MRSKIFVVLIAVAVMGTGSAAMARGGGGGGGGGGGKGGSGGHFGPAQVGQHQFNRFERSNQVIGGWGWGLGAWGWTYSEGSYSNMNCISRNSETFTVPSSAGGSRPVQLVTCR
jgi:hypothetical protein